MEISSRQDAKILRRDRKSQVSVPLLIAKVFAQPRRQEKTLGTGADRENGEGFLFLGFLGSLRVLA